MKANTPSLFPASRWWMPVILLGLAISGNGRAQVLYGTLLGNVNDASGSVVPQAKVSATNTATGQLRTTETDERGFYAFRDLQPGSYRVDLTATGFAPAGRPGIQVSINTVTRLDVALQVESVSQSLDVAAAAPSLQTDRADVHVDLASKEITDLPLSGFRNYQSLVNLVPGGAAGGRFQRSDDALRSLYRNGRWEEPHTLRGQPDFACPAECDRAQDAVVRAPAQPAGQRQQLFRLRTYGVQPP